MTAAPRTGARLWSGGVGDAAVWAAAAAAAAILHLGLARHGLEAWQAALRAPGTEAPRTRIELATVPVARVGQAEAGAAAAVPSAAVSTTAAALPSAAVIAASPGLRAAAAANQGRVPAAALALDPADPASRPSAEVAARATATGTADDAGRRPVASRTLPQAAAERLRSGEVQVSVAPLAAGTATTSPVDGTAAPALPAPADRPAPAVALHAGQAAVQSPAAAVPAPYAAEPQRASRATSTSSPARTPRADPVATVSGGPPAAASLPLRDPAVLTAPPIEVAHAGAGAFDPPAAPLAAPPAAPAAWPAAGPALGVGAMAQPGNPAPPAPTLAPTQAPASIAEFGTATARVSLPAASAPAARRPEPSRPPAVAPAGTVVAAAPPPAPVAAPGPGAAAARPGVAAPIAAVSGHASAERRAASGAATPTATEAAAAVQPAPPGGPDAPQKASPGTVPPVAEASSTPAIGAVADPNRAGRILQPTAAPAAAVTGALPGATRIAPVATVREGATGESAAPALPAVRAAAPPPPPHEAAPGTAREPALVAAAAAASAVAALPPAGAPLPQPTEPPIAADPGLETAPQAAAIPPPEATGPDRDGVASPVDPPAEAPDSDNTYAAVLDFLARYPAPPCFVALPSLSDTGSFQFEVFARSAAEIAAFRSAIETETGQLPNTRMKPVSAEQCRALEFLRDSPSYPAFRLYFALDEREIASGSRLEGRLGNIQDGHVSLFVIDDDGIVQDLGRFLRFSRQGAVFSIPMSLTGEPVETVQLLMGLSSRAAPGTARRMDGTSAADFFRVLAAEVRAGGEREDIALIAFAVR